MNFESGLPEESFGVKFIGSEGTSLPATIHSTLSRRPRETEPGYTIDTFPAAVQKEFLEEYRRKYPGPTPTADSISPDRDDRFEPPSGFDSHLEHHRSFYRSIRENQPSIEDAVFGFRAAGPALLTNASYFERKACLWDPVQMRRTA